MGKRSNASLRRNDQTSGRDGGVPKSQLPGIIQRIKARVDQEISVAVERNEFWETTTILLGMRLPLESVKSLLQGVVNLKESSVIQGFIDEGELKGARKVLLSIGQTLFGPPDEHIREQIESFHDSDLITELASRAPNTKSWDELMAEAQRLQS